LEELKNFQKENGHCLVPGLHTKDSETYPLALWVARQRQQYKLLRENKTAVIITEERIQKLKDLGFEWVLSPSWDERFAELKAFQKEHGHFRVPTPMRSDTHQVLYRWLRNQRKCTSMSEERMQKLNDIGFEFPQGNHWDKRFEELKAFQNEHGHMRVPNRSPTNKDRDIHLLNQWVSNQRRSTTITEERIQKLNALGFDWFLRKRRTYCWDERLEELKAFQKEHGHCRVPLSTGKYSELYHWVSNQRKRTSMTEERIQKLNDIGYEWSLRVLVDWDERFEELRAFQNEHGHCRVSQAEKDDDTHQLALWVKLQRKEYKLYQEGKNSTITQGRIQKLNGVGFTWSILSQQRVSWGERLEALKAFQQEHGHSRVPTSKTYALANWGAKQRGLYVYARLGKKPKDWDPKNWGKRVQKLDEIGFDW
jgi:hypothetical protein